MRNYEKPVLTVTRIQTEGVFAGSGEGFTNGGALDNMGGNTCPNGLKRFNKMDAKCQRCNGLKPGGTPATNCFAGLK